MNTPTDAFLPTIITHQQETSANFTRGRGASILDEKGCHGAPDWIIEIVSPSSERMDYVVKTFKYRTAGVREYWVIDKTLQKVTVFDFENDNMFEYDFTQKIPVLIYDGELEIDLSRFI